ncbi:MAG: hypothetical protein WBL81_17345, partial [Pseudolabrys sp.]
MRSAVIAGHVPAIPIIRARHCRPKRDGRDKPGHDNFYILDNRHINQPTVHAGVSTTRPITLPARSSSITAFTSS